MEAAFRARRSYRLGIAVRWGTGGQSDPAAKVITPTATAVLEKEWPTDGRFFKSPTGRWRKRTKRGKEGSMNWAQEMLVRAVMQHNPRLMPTPEDCESMMGFPVGWTDPAKKRTQSELSSANTGSFFAKRSSVASESHAQEMQDSTTADADVIQAVNGRQDMETNAIINPGPDILSGSLQAMDNEVLASEFKRRYTLIGKRLKELRPFYVELRTRFFDLPTGDSIMGCTTWTDFCEEHLKYSDRHVRRLIEGDNPATEKHRSKSKLSSGLRSGSARTDSGMSVPDESAGKSSVAISHSPADDSQTGSKEEAVRRIVSWTLSSIKNFSVTEKRQIVEDAIVKLQDELALEEADTVKPASGPCSFAPVTELPQASTTRPLPENLKRKYQKLVQAAQRDVIPAPFVVGELVRFIPYEGDPTDEASPTLNWLKQTRTLLVVTEVFEGQRGSGEQVLNADGTPAVWSKCNCGRPGCKHEIPVLDRTEDGYSIVELPEGTETPEGFAREQFKYELDWDAQLDWYPSWREPEPQDEDELDEENQTASAASILPATSDEQVRGKNVRDERLDSLEAGGNAGIGCCWTS